MQDGWTALALAAYHGHTQIVHILLNAGASPDIQGQVHCIAEHQCVCVRLCACIMCVCVCMHGVWMYTDVCVCDCACVCACTLILWCVCINFVFFMCARVNVQLQCNVLNWQI
jgi:hypothetical protein